MKLTLLALGTTFALITTAATATTLTPTVKSGVISAKKCKAGYVRTSSGKCVRQRRGS